MSPSALKVSLAYMASLVAGICFAPRDFFHRPPTRRLDDVASFAAPLALAALELPAQALNLVNDGLFNSRLFTNVAAGCAAAAANHAIMASTTWDLLWGLVVVLRAGSICRAGCVVRPTPLKPGPARPPTSVVNVCVTADLRRLDALASSALSNAVISPFGLHPKRAFVNAPSRRASRCIFLRVA